MVKCIMFDWGGTLGYHKKRSSNLHKDGTISVEKLRETYLFIDTVETLQYLKSKGYKIAIVTNSDLNTNHNIEVMIALEIYNLIDFVLSSGDENMCEKPCSKIFISACEKLKVDPKDCAYVGNNYFNDIIASKKLGMVSVYLEDPKYNKYKNQTEDYCIKSLNELKNIF